MRALTAREKLKYETFLDAESGPDYFGIAVLEYGKGNYAQAREFFLETATKGNFPPDTLVYLGIMARDGQGVQKDVGRAMGFFKKAAEANYAPAYRFLADLLAVSQTKSPDASKYFVAARDVALAGFNKTIQSIREAKGEQALDSSFELAVGLIETLATDDESNFAKATLTAAEYQACMLVIDAFKHRFGLNGVALNKAEAFRLYATAADVFEDPTATYELGYMYRDGEGVTADEDKARAYLAKVGITLEKPQEQGAASARQDEPEASSAKLEASPGELKQPLEEQVAAAEIDTGVLDKEIKKYQTAVTTLAKDREALVEVGLVLQRAYSALKDKLETKMLTTEAFSREYEALIEQFKPKLEQLQIQFDQEAEFDKVLGQFQPIHDAVTAKFSKNPEEYRDLFEKSAMVTIRLEAGKSIYFEQLGHTKQDNDRFEKYCKKTIKSTGDVFATHRGFFGYPRWARIILGVVATVTVVPGIVVAASAGLGLSKHGYVDTFFKEAPETDSAERFKGFKEKFDTLEQGSFKKDAPSAEGDKDEPEPEQGPK